jgi:hypothetical protein
MPECFVDEDVEQRLRLLYTPAMRRTRSLMLGPVRIGFQHSSRAKLFVHTLQFSKWARWWTLK